MSIRIRQFVALVSIPLALSSGLAFAGKTAPVVVPGDIAFASVCEYPLDTTEMVIRTPGYFLTNNAASNRDNLLAKLMGADIKLTESKPGDAFMILDDILQKVEEWSLLPGRKQKLTDDGAAAITSAVAGVVTCIHDNFKY
jgi:hypothetical protein